jgi:ureidoglycolate dehydrogenase (NAD+)
MGRLVTQRDLESLCRSLLERVGMSKEHAATVTDSLVAADLRGVGSHGVLRLPIYIKRMRMGLINVAPRMRVERTAAATARLDGDDGPGQVVVLRAMEEAVALARESGVGLCVAHRSNHFGIAAQPARYAAGHGMIGICMANSEADVVPFGGRTPWLGTNPLAIAVPTQADPITLDMATSVVAMGKVLLAAAENRPIPEGWAVDAKGDPVTDPSQARAVLPFGGPKGYGLGVIVEALSALLSGAGFGIAVKRMYDDFDEPQRLGHLVAAIDVARFVDSEEFASRATEFVASITSVAPAEGHERVMVPGEPEADIARKRRAEGIPLDESVIGELIELAADLGVQDVPATMR